jgi:hypothetical protein
MMMKLLKKLEKEIGFPITNVQGSRLYRESTSFSMFKWRILWYSSQQVYIEKECSILK